MNATAFEGLYRQGVQRIRDLSAESKALQVVKRQRQESILRLRFEIGRIVDGLMADRYVDGVKVITWRMLEADTGISQQHLICMRHFYNHPPLLRDVDAMKAWVADLERATWNDVMGLVTGWKQPGWRGREEREALCREPIPHRFVSDEQPAPDEAPAEQPGAPPIPMPAWAKRSAPTAAPPSNEACVYECPNCGGEVTKAELRRSPAPPNAPVFDPWERRRRLKRLKRRDAV